MIGHFMLNETQRNQVQCARSWHKFGAGWSVRESEQ